jgi:hypothetical protein
MFLIFGGVAFRMLRFTSLPDDGLDVNKDLVRCIGYTILFLNTNLFASHRFSVERLIQRIE